MTNEFVWHYFLYNENDHGGFYGQAKDTIKDKRHNDPVYSKLLSSWRANGVTPQTFWYKVPCTGLDKSGKPIQNDRDIHPLLGKSTLVSKRDIEYFLLNKSTTLSLFQAEVKSIHELAFGGHETERQNTFSPRYYQQEFLTKLSNSWGQYREFLLFAKCRAGKSFMTLKHVKDFGHKLTVVVSRTTSPAKSWKDDVSNHTDFVGMVFIDLNDRNAKKQLDIAMASGNQVIVFSTIQRLHKSPLPYDVDFLVYDEADLGMGTPTQWEKVRAQVDCHILYITGTAYNMADMFNDECKFVYLYAQEQQDMKDGQITGRGRMKVVMPTFDVPGYEAIYGDDPDRITNLLSLNEDKTDFAEPDLVRKFISKYFDHEGGHHKRALFRGRKHLYITLPGMDECHVFARYMRDSSFSNAMVVTSDTTEDQETIVDFIDSHETSCILTVDANVRGVTTKKVDAVVLLRNTKSLAIWNQFVFRGGSGSHNWLVVDFNEARTLGFLHEMMVIESEETNAECAFNVTDFADVFGWEDGFNEMNEHKINSILSSEFSSTTRMMRGLVNGIDLDILSHIEFSAELIPSSGGSEVSIGNRLGNDDSSTKREMNGVDGVKEQDNPLEELRHIEAILQSLPICIAHNLNDGMSVVDVDSLIKSKFYTNDTQDLDGALIQYIERDASYKKRLNRRILSVSRDISASIQKSYSMTLEELFTTAGGQRPIPGIILKQMLNSNV
jgi:hypothetical protein